MINYREEPCDEETELDDADDDDLIELVNGNTLFKAVVADGVICSVEKGHATKIHWSHKFEVIMIHNQDLNALTDYQFPCGLKMSSY